MDKKVLGIVVVILVVGTLVAGIAVSNKNKKSNNNSNSVNSNNASTTREIKSVENAHITIYYGEGCPHCKIVEEDIIKENIDQKIDLNMKEVWYNKNNANEMSAKADICKLNKDELGVPMLYDAIGQKCYVGDADVTSFLEEKAVQAGDSSSSSNNNVNTNANTNTEVPPVPNTNS